MRFLKAFELGLNILLNSKLRSWLTIIGIVIGVGAVVAIVSIGEGLQASVQSRLGGFGADQITLSPGGGRAQAGLRGFGGGAGQTQVTGDGAKNLTDKDIRTIKTTQGVAVVAGSVSGRAETYFLGEKAQLSVSGIDPQPWQQLTTSELASGRFLGPTDAFSAVIGSRIAASTFKDTIGVNQLISIENKTFKVVGVLKESGSFGGADSQVLIPLKIARDVIPDVGDKKYDSITIKASSVDAVDLVMADIDMKLMATRQVTNRTKDYQLSSAKQTQAQISSVTDTLTLFLAAIAAVSLLVGAVGIANTMFTSVLEKTREIGIMKAIGARNRDILLIFIINAALVGLVGGIIGIIVGSLASFAIPLAGVRLGFGGPGGGTLSTVITLKLLIFALGIAVATGVIAGIIPAWRASRLRPVDALRYE